MGVAVLEGDAVALELGSRVNVKLIEKFTLALLHQDLFVFANEKLLIIQTRVTLTLKSMGVSVSVFFSPGAAATEKAILIFEGA